MPPLVSLAELEARFGRDYAGTPEEARARAALTDASGLVRAEVRPASLSPVPDAVVTIVCQAAGRALRNPEGFSSENAGDYSYRYGDAAVDGVYLTDAERAVLRRIDKRAGLRSTRTPYSSGEHRENPAYRPVLYPNGVPGEPFPWEEPPPP